MADVEVKHDAHHYCGPDKWLWRKSGVGGGIVLGDPRMESAEESHLRLRLELLLDKISGENEEGTVEGDLGMASWLVT